MSISYLVVGGLGVAIVADAGTSTVSAVAGGFPATGVAGASSRTLSPSLHTDSDTFNAPAVAADQFLTAGLVSDSDAFNAPTLTSSYPLTPALVASDDATFAPIATIIQSLLPALVTDADNISATTLVYIPALRPALFASDDAVYSATVNPGTRTLSPGRVTDADSFLFPWYVTQIGDTGGPQQKLKPPPKVQDTDTIFAARMSSTTGVVIDLDIIRVPIVTASSSGTAVFVSETDTIFTTSVAAVGFLRPALLNDADAIYDPVLARVFEPQLLASDDDIPAADVGWQVIAEFTDDDEAIFSVNAYAFYPLYPEVWFDEEHIDTYPFFVQSVEGGIPVPPREGVLTGSIKSKPVLTGSIARRRLVA